MIANAKRLDFSIPLVRSRAQGLLAPLDPVGELVSSNLPGTTRSAAVLIPCCSLRIVSETNRQASTEPGLLFTVRSRLLRNHAGEVSFPGGLFDLRSDRSLQQTALRETLEEVPSFTGTGIQLLGRLPAVPDRSGTIAVHPFVGFVGDFTLRQQNENHHSSAILHHYHKGRQWPIRFNPDEVSDCFYLSWRHLLDPNNVTMMRLGRGGSGLMVPSWVGVERPRDSDGSMQHDQQQQQPELAPVNSIQTAEGRVHYRVWGLTAYILSRFMSQVIRPLLKD